jgi:hypothetical protein
MLLDSSRDVRNSTSLETYVVLCIQWCRMLFSSNHCVIDVYEMQQQYRIETNPILSSSRAFHASRAFRASSSCLPPMRCYL